MTGHAPFVGETPSHTILQVLQKEPTSPRKINPNVPRDLETICLKCLEKAPLKRYGTAQLLGEDLQLFLEGKPVKARPVSTIERSWRWCRRNSILTALLAVILLVVLCAPIVVWYQVATIVDGVQDARGAALPELISDLQKYPSLLVTPILNSRFKAQSDSRRKLSLAFALAAFGTVETDYLVDQVDGVGEADTGNLLDALAADREASLKVLRAEEVTSASEKNWRRKSQLAILALHLGDSALAVDMCQIENRPDPTQRTFFIDEFPKWHVNTKALTEVVKSSRDRGFCSAILLGVGSISSERLHRDAMQDWQTLAEEWYISRADGLTHSSSGWLLRRWNVRLPEIANDNGYTMPKSWYINGHGQTFLLMSAGSFHRPEDPVYGRKNRDVVISESFWLSDREVSVGQFQRFMEDTDYAPADKPVGWPPAPASVRPAGATLCGGATCSGHIDPRSSCGYVYPIGVVILTSRRDEI